jgi:hypothetical protein
MTRLVCFHWTTLSSRHHIRAPAEAEKLRTYIPCVKVCPEEHFDTFVRIFPSLMREKVDVIQ